MTDKLTQRQEKFVQGLVAGLSQRKAYKEAYNAFLSALHGMNNSAFRDLELLDEKLRAEISVIKSNIHQETPVKDDKFIEAMSAMVESIWEDENQKEKP